MYGKAGAVFGVFVIVLAAVAGAQSPQIYTKNSQDGTPIPDVNKVAPGNLADSSCWLASAANVLAAAGYGGMGQASIRASTIYGQLTAAYGIASGGAPDHAISYWLNWHGKNPASPNYAPALSYTDVTAVYRTLSQTDYNFLKDELHRCQYVGVQFDSPAHAMTLVGWDDILGRSTWHDSDKTIGITGDDVYINSFTTTWDLLDPNTMAVSLAHANGYITLCPGLNKSPEAVANYDLAWGPSPTGPIAREAGIMAGVFGPAPGWQTQWQDPQNPNATYDPFAINNVMDPVRRKIIELLVDYYGRDENYVNQDIRLLYLDQLGQQVVAQPTSRVLSDDNGQVLFTWLLDCQPAWEQILFPSYFEFGLLEGEVASWNVSIVCVPEPMTLLLLGFGGLAGCGARLLRRRVSRG